MLAPGFSRLYVGPRFFQTGHQTRADRIRHRGDENGCILYHLGARLSGGRGNGKHQVGFFTLDLFGDEVSRGDITLGDVNIVAHIIPFLLEYVLKAAPDRIKGGVFDDLVHRNGVLISGENRRGGKAQRQNYEKYR
jgi:hypothetical protein